MKLMVKVIMKVMTKHFTVNQINNGNLAMCLVPIIFLYFVISFWINFYIFISCIKNKTMQELLNFEPVLSGDDPEDIKKYYKDNNIEIPNIQSFQNFLNTPPTYSVDNVENVESNEIPSFSQSEKDNKETSQYPMFSKTQKNYNWTDHFKSGDKKVPSRKGFFPNVNLTNDIVNNLNKSKKDIVSEINNMPIDEGDKKYLSVMAERESSFHPDVTNQLGYYGLYQFGKSAFNDVGTSKENFRKDTKNQHEGALKLAKINEGRLKPIINSFVGKNFNGIPITLNGIRAAAHLLGAGTVKDFFMGTTKSKIAKEGFVDGNKVHITEYLKLFK